jgi:hypothetical protein
MAVVSSRGSRRVFTPFGLSVKVFGADLPEAKNGVRIDG